MKVTKVAVGCLVTVSCLALLSCGSGSKADPAAEAPPPAKVESEADVNLVTVEDAAKFPVIVAGRLESSATLTANGAVFPDVSRQVPAISLASGRAIQVLARIGDTVRKDQILLRVQSADISGAYQDYLKAVADEKLARAQLERARVLTDKGALAQKDLEVSENVEEDAKVTVDTTLAHLKELGADPNHVSDIVDVRAPISGVLTEQNVTAGAGVKTPDNSPNLFTVSDLSEVWIICDVYENDLEFVKLGQYADVHLSAYPKLSLKGRISDIGPILDPSIRTAKVRLQVSNPGVLRVGMFVTASFHSGRTEVRASVPTTAILHLHDREWAYEPVGPRKFRRVEVVGGNTLPDGSQEVTSGIVPGDKVVKNALILQSTVEQ